MVDVGVECVIEVGLGKVLMGLNKWINKGFVFLVVNMFESVEVLK